MSVLWDAPLASSVARELEARLDGARVRAVLMDRDARNLVLYFRSCTLVFRLHPLRGDVALLEPREPPPEARKLKAGFREIHSPPDERLLMLQLQPYGGSPDPEGLVVELMTNQWNAVWLQVGSGRIRRVLWPRELRDRTLAGGERYRRPSPSERRGIEAPLDEGEWLELLGSAEPQRRRRALLRSVAFTSSLVAPSLLGTAADGGSDAGETTEDRLRAGHRLWLRIRGVALGEEEAEPRLVRTEKRAQPYPLALPHADSEACSSLLDGFRRATSGEGEEAPADVALLPSGLLERLEDVVRDAERKADRLRGELADTPDPEPIRRTGDLILARFDRVEQGAGRATLEGFDGEPVEVDLDPSLSPDENAKRYYREAARAERARERLPALIRKAEERAGELERLLERARSGEATPEEVRETLPPEPEPQRKDEEKDARLPYRTYRSSGGLEIRVGRSAEANEDLTFHHSKPDDVWMHARRVPGAHVILRWDREGDPPARDLAQAATLAALHSDARHSGSVPVDWTRRKYVRSPRKSAPGVVVPDRVQTVFVEPDPELEKMLRAR